MSMKYCLNAPLENSFEVYNVGSKVFTFRIKELAEHISKLTNAKISIADKNPKDSRSYTVDFTRFETWFKDKWPLYLLEDTVEELTNFYSKTIKKYGKNHFNNFRNSSQYIRLKMLQEKKEKEKLLHDKELKEERTEIDNIKAKQKASEAKRRVIRRRRRQKEEYAEELNNLILKLPNSVDATNLTRLLNPEFQPKYVYDKACLSEDEKRVQTIMARMDLYS